MAAIGKRLVLKISVGSGSGAFCQPACFRGAPRQQITDKMLQPLLFSGLKTQKLDPHVILPDIANDSFDRDRLVVVCDPQAHDQHVSFVWLAAFRAKGAPAHGNVASHPTAWPIVSSEGQRESRRQTLIFPPIFFHPKIADTPLQSAEPMAAQLAFEGIDVEETQETFSKTNAGDPSNILFGTVWTS